MIIKAIRCLAVVSLMATLVSHAHAGWGCGAYNGSGSVGRSWSAGGESEARRVALEQCDKVRRQYNEDAACRVKSCSENVDTREQSRALWPTQ